MRSILAFLILAALLALSGPAGTAVMINSYTAGGGGGSGDPLEITQTATGVSTTNVTNSTYTFSSQSLGAAATDRIIAVALGGIGLDEADTVSAVTIGGVSATQQFTVQDGSAEVEVWTAAVPTGTTGDVVATITGSASNLAMAVWRLVGKDPSVNISPSSTGSDTGDSGSSLICDNFTIPSGGGALAFTLTESDEDGHSSHAWTNMDEDCDAQIEGDTAYSCSTKETAGLADRTVTATGGDDPLDDAAVLACVAFDNG